MAKVVRVGVSPSAPGKLKRLDGGKRKVASIAELRAEFFARNHTGDCKPAPQCGSHCYILGPVAKLKIATIRQYRSIAHTWGDKLDSMGEVTPDHVTHMMNLAISAGKARATANMALHVLRTMAHIVSDMRDKPRFRKLYLAIKRIQPHKQSRLRPRNPPPDVVARIYKMLTPLEQNWVVLMARTGLRKGEMLALTPESYVPHMQELWVTAGSREDMRNRKLYEDQLTKQLTPDSSRRLEWLIANQVVNARRQGRAKGAPLPGWLFPWGKNYPDEIMRRIRAHLGDDAARYFPAKTAWHALRHFSVYQVVEQVRGRADAAVIVKEHLGHKCPDSAMAYLAAARGMSCTPEVQVDLGDGVQ